MKIGVITDIHNNISALDAVLEKFSLLKIDRIICCGDIIGIGAQPEKTVKKIMSLSNIDCVKGNHDNYLVDMPDKVPNNEMMSADEIKHHKWEHNELSDISVKFLKSLPFSKSLRICSKRIYVSHYSMNNHNRYVNYAYKQNPALEDLKMMFKDIEADIIIYGHNHTPSVITEKDKWFINSGSLGCPLGEKNARAGILTIDDGVSYEQLRIPYNVDEVVDNIKTLKYPDYLNILKYFYGVTL